MEIRSWENRIRQGILLLGNIMPNPATQSTIYGSHFLHFTVHTIYSVFHTIPGHFAMCHFHFLRHDYPRISSSALCRSEL